MTREQAMADLFLLFCGQLPPIATDKPFERLRELPDYEAVQSFVVSHLRLPWLTGIGILEAIDTLVEEAVCNSEKAFAAAKPVLLGRESIGPRPKKKPRSLSALYNETDRVALVLFYGDYPDKQWREQTQAKRNEYWERARASLDAIGWKGNTL